MHEDNSEEGGIDLYRARNVNHFLEIPLSLRFSLSNDTIRGFLGAGLYNWSQISFNRKRKIECA